MPSNDEPMKANESDKQVGERRHDRASNGLDRHDVELWHVSILPIVRPSLPKSA